MPVVEGVRETYTLLPVTVVNNARTVHLQERSWIVLTSTAYTLRHATSAFYHELKVALDKCLGQQSLQNRT